MAEAVGFEPTDELPRHRISSAARYDHFGTLPCDDYSTTGQGNLQAIEQMRRRPVPKSFFRSLSEDNTFISRRENRNA